MASRFSPQLLADNGQASESDGFFRSRTFFEAEGVTHTLCIREGSDNVLAIPLIVRSIPGTDYLDAVSPYGFPGGTVLRPACLEANQLDWSPTGLVSIFLRNRIGTPPVITDGNLRGTVQIVDPGRPLSIRRNHRCDIKRNTALGYTTETVPGPDSSPEDRRMFRELYWQTMNRQSARPWYLFPEAYFETILRSDRSRLIFTRDPSGRLAAGIHLVYSDNMLHCYLAGTGDEFLGHSPSKNAFHTAIEIAREQNLPLNLGGGMRSGDSLEHFKVGFSNHTEPFFTHEIVCDTTTYCLLSRTHTKTDYFPIYRSAP